MLSHNEPMKNHCSLRVGGNARYFFIPQNLSELSNFLQNNKKPVLMLGLGSNLLVRERGFDGVVISLKKFKKLSIKNKIISSEAGVSLAKLSRFAALHQCSGAAFLSAIPGVLGGALAMNAGAFTKEIWDFVVSVRTISVSGVIYQRDKSAWKIGYRQVEAEHKNEYFISAELAFNHPEKQNINDLLSQRNQSQPIGKASCGSVFKNPKGAYAGELIEQSQLKGFAIGGACVSSKHANFIINQNNANSTDIENLIKHIQKTVKAKFNIQLETELKIV